MTPRKHQVSCTIPPEVLEDIHREITQINARGRALGYDNLFAAVWIGWYEGYMSRTPPWDFGNECRITIDGVPLGYGLVYLNPLTPSGWLKIEADLTIWNGGLGTTKLRYMLYFDRTGKLVRTVKTK